MTRIADRVRALSRCTFLPGTRDKRFARDMAIIVDAGCPLTIKQVEHINRLARKYRRQMPADTIPHDQLPTDAE